MTGFSTSVVGHELSSRHLDDKWFSYLWLTLRTIYKIFMHTITGRPQLQRILMKGRHSSRMTYEFMKCLIYSKELHAVVRNEILNIESRPFQISKIASDVINAKKIRTRASYVREFCSNLQFSLLHISYTNQTFYRMLLLKRAPFLPEDAAHVMMLNKLWQLLKPNERIRPLKKTESKREENVLDMVKDEELEEEFTKTGKSVDYVTEQINNDENPLSTKTNNTFDEIGSTNGIRIHLKSPENGMKTDGIDYSQRVDLVHSTDWSDIGFQSTNPATDFRAGMGILGLIQLVHFAETENEVARTVLLDSCHPSYGYPFAITGINISAFLMNDLLSEGRLRFYMFQFFDHSRGSNADKKSKKNIGFISSTEMDSDTPSINLNPLLRFGQESDGLINDQIINDHDMTMACYEREGEENDDYAEGSDMSEVFTDEDNFVEDEQRPEGGNNKEGKESRLLNDKTPLLESNNVYEKYNYNTIKMENGKKKDKTESNTEEETNYVNGKLSETLLTPLSQGNYSEYINDGKTTYEGTIKKLLEEYIQKCATAKPEKVTNREDITEYDDLNESTNSDRDTIGPSTYSSYYSSNTKNEKMTNQTDAEQNMEVTLAKGIKHIHELYTQLFYDFNETYKSANPQNLLSFPPIFEKWKKKIKSMFAKS